MLPTDRLEVIVGALLAVAAVGAVVFPLVALLAYLLFREPVHSTEVPATAAPKAPPAQARQDAHLPTAIAG